MASSDAAGAIRLTDQGMAEPSPSNAPSTSVSHSCEESGESFGARMSKDIEELAHRITHKPSRGPESTALNPAPGTSLDPLSQAFNARTWVKEYTRLVASDPKSAAPRTLGVAFRSLSVFGWSAGAEFQKTTGSILIGLASYLARLARGNKRGRRIDILCDFDGVIGEGEMLVVLGPPGSGCSTFLKTLAGETADLQVDPGSYINFRGIDPSHVRSSLRGDVLYNAEIDTHLAHLSVGETLAFAARARSARHIPGGFTREQADAVNRDVMMAVFGLTHTVDTRVGDDFVRGVSGGERKRVSIAEAALTGAKFQCWDNSTRGLDSANAISFCRNLRLQADLLGVASAVSLYQAPQSAFDLFDRVTVIYEGRQIFFGRVAAAKGYFEGLGFECPERQTTPDFLTSMTSPVERRVRVGFEHLVPRTPDEFVQRWRVSRPCQELTSELAVYEQKHPPKERLAQYQQSRRAEQAKAQRPSSPYTISYAQQVSLTLWRAYRRLIADPGFTVASMVFNAIMALLLGSMFYNLKQDSSTLYYRAGSIFFSLIFNAFSSQLEVLTIYAERPIVEKHKRYAFYHQSAQAIASYLADIPSKFLSMITFNLIFYFMVHLRREPGSFFFYCLATFLATLVQSAVFRTLACMTRTPSEAMVPSALLGLGLIIYTGFTTPTAYMPGWSRWMTNVNPLAFAFESLVANEFHGREFPCVGMVPRGPGYDGLPSASQVCAVVGAEPGSSTVSGDSYINQSFGYWNTHKWRNIGIVCGFWAFFFAAYLVAAEFAKPPKTRGEVLVFRRGKVPSRLAKAEPLDQEAQPQGRPIVAEKEDAGSGGLAAGTSVFHWEDLCYDIKIKGKAIRLLDHVDGWVKPGVSTALMGVSGAGKTTLLDVLATRATLGIVGGKTLVNGDPTDASFQHRVGYVQQQDLHLSTMTVREALEFSALLRQSAEVSRQTKIAYVDHVIDMLEMRDFADAVIGVPGEGLNVEQRKRLTIGVELAARPQLLIFFDEPTSGLDSQTSWAISVLIKKLTNSGQAVLCTIHQPSAILFDQFDRLLLIAPGGKTAYFGDLGKGSAILIDYFERHGASHCPPGANPAEWMLQIIERPVAGSGGIDWHKAWRDSSEYQGVKAELTRLRALPVAASVRGDNSQHQEFVASFGTQFREVLTRTIKHFWRSPTYIWSKTSLVVLSTLFLGFSFGADNSIQGLQNQLWAQIMPMFVPQRALYEVRERPSKIYRWNTYIAANIVVELGWNTAMAAIMYFCWYYPVGFVRNTSPDDQAIRGLLVFLFLWMYLLFTSTFAHLAITWIDLPETAGVLTSFCWMLCILFCGVGVARADLPGFWSFMYRVSPATYLVGGLMSAAVANSEVACAARETVRVAPPGNMTCGDFLGPFAGIVGGLVLDPAARDECGYCPLASTNEFLGMFDISYGNRWRDFGLLWVYILANIAGALGLYWVFRVPKGNGTKRGN